jgi:hypothetical protein
MPGGLKAARAVKRSLPRWPPGNIEVADRQAAVAVKLHTHVMDYFRQHFTNFEDATTKLSSPDYNIHFPFPYAGAALPARFKLQGHHEHRMYSKPSPFHKNKDILTDN